MRILKGIDTRLGTASPAHVMYTETNLFASKADLWHMKTYGSQGS